MIHYNTEPHQLLHGLFIDDVMWPTEKGTHANGSKKNNLPASINKNIYKQLVQYSQNVSWDQQNDHKIR